MQIKSDCALLKMTNEKLDYYILNPWFPGHIPNQPASESIAICVSLAGFSFYETQSAHCPPNSKIKKERPS